MARSGGVVLVLLLIPGLSYPAIISRDQSGEIVTSEAFTVEAGASGAIDATASRAFPNAGLADAADTQIPAEGQSGGYQPSRPQKSATHPEMSMFYLLVIVMIFALFIELTGNRFR